jgi:D-beta-D-heptose 7-phosphate kinase / D-beta-D-heptose 1-phosphate adenosyltransferase
MSAELLQAIEQWGTPRILVLGDVMLDRYIWGDAERISQEAPVILLRADKREERLGGASSVATMLSHLGAEVLLAGVIGSDSDAQRVRQIIDGLDIDQSTVLNDDSRPTTVKERYIGRAQQKHPQQMIRVDFESRAELAPELEATLEHLLLDVIPTVDVVLVSDYDKGVCTPHLVQAVIRAAREANKPVLVDPIRCKSVETPHPYDKYRGCTTMTPNRLEASLASGLPVSTAEQALQAAKHLLHHYEMDASIITLDKDGMALVMENGMQAIVPTRPRQVYDITGAGDMVLSVLGMALAHGADLSTAIRLANVAGGLEVEKIGVAPVTREEMIADIEQVMRIEANNNLNGKVQPIDAMQHELVRLRSQGKRIVFTNGCFDILHAGHVQYLREAKAQGDILIVGLNSDQSVRDLKGPSRPINCQSERALVLAALGSVDFVSIFDENTPLELIQAYRPEVLVKGADYRKEEVVGAREVESWGGRVHLANMRPGCSTTGTILRMAGQTNTSDEELRKVA